jgi:hypothetical protein
VLAYDRKKDTSKNFGISLTVLGSSDIAGGDKK